MGCIPIIKHSSLDPLYDDLPVILVHDWTEINEYFLEQKYRDLSRKTYPQEKMYADYWINIIRSFQLDGYTSRN
jgi:hypothetical protein